MNIPGISPSAYNSIVGTVLPQNEPPGPIPPPIRPPEPVAKASKIADSTQSLTPPTSRVDTKA